MPNGELKQREMNTEPGHGVRAAFYSNLPGPGQIAILECLCGFEATMHSKLWEEAGTMMDEHLETVGPDTVRKVE